MTASTAGRAHTLGVSGGVSFPVWQASAKYDYQWNRSTTDTKSFTQTFTTQSPTKPESVQWRWRLYQRGWLFTGTKSRHIPIPCIAAGDYYSKRRYVVPTTRAIYSFHVERYALRGYLLDADGVPFKPW
ncbi:hypothetical protein GCM10011584_26900 [Nocardioides phosphati]|uniref:Uncharacterized protein n=1 Tax=Nocardioides phosphati TaxID=1867775 RepID=A0ABQ2NDZ1_9ACTN|nr:hypothetical protein [Nocardioides phosphati]GGO91848.1 hypothetical protein GCM10011584_26900 [Nocardioides phosphati]